MEPAVVLRGLRKRYASGTEAVAGIDLAVAPGEIFGIIGPDGAGKTTTFQILSGIMEASDGDIRVFDRAPREARALVGYLTQIFSLYPDLSVTENLRYTGEMRGIAPEAIRERGAHYLALFDMDRFGDRLAGRLSGGMKQKLALACALIAQPRLLLLDEPTTGVDPVSRREFWDTLADLAASGMTIVVATPYLDEAERCGRVALMYEGRIQQVGTPTELREGLNLQRLEVRAADLGKAADVLRTDEAGGIRDIQRFGDRLDVLVSDAVAGERGVREHLAAAGIAVTDIRVAVPTLENVFVAVLRELGTGVDERRAREVPGRERQPAGDAVAIGARDLRKVFGDFVAVNGVDITVRYGEIYGLLGANGAGKTTTIKMLCGLLAPTGGEMILAGARGAEAARSSSVRQRIGYMSQKFSLYDDLTIGENLEFFAGIYGVPPAARPERKRWVLEFAGLAGRADLLTGALPGGWKQRVAFGAAIMHEPEVLFLDEPTSGVDPIARRAFWQVINRLADRGVAILVTTHYLEEAEQCNRLGFMVAGELVTEGTPTGVKAAQGGHLLALRTDRPQQAANLLKRTRDRWRVSLFGDRLHVIVDGDDTAAEVERLRGELAAQSITMHDAREEPYSLEDVFITVVEKAREQGKVGREE